MSETIIANPANPGSSTARNGAGRTIDDDEAHLSDSERGPAPPRFAEDGMLLVDPETHAVIGRRSGLHSRARIQFGLATRRLRLYGAALCAVADIAADGSVNRWPGRVTLLCSPAHSSRWPDLMS
jgi:hypothetical protein